MSSSIGTKAPQPTARPSTRATKKALFGAETKTGSKSPTAGGGASYRCRTSSTKAFKSSWASGLRGSSGETVIVIASEGIKDSERSPGAGAVARSQTYEDGRARLPNDLRKKREEIRILWLSAGNADAFAEPVHGEPLSPTAIARGRAVLSANPRKLWLRRPVIVAHAGPGSARASALPTERPGKRIRFVNGFRSCGSLALPSPDYSIGYPVSQKR